MSVERAYDPRVPRRHPRTESFTLGVLLRAEIVSAGGTVEPIPGRWVEVAKRLLELGMIGVTARRGVYRLHESGRAELRRLHDLGVIPADGTLLRTPRRAP